MRTPSKTIAPEQKLYAPYLDAVWGLKNHWYPALFSHELSEGAMQGVTISGTPILIQRRSGKVYGMLDQCPHRGVKLSLKPTCLTEGTISCWYHGFTFDIESGNLVSIVAAPTDDLIGKVRVRTFPVQEHKGMIFVFVGDEDYTPVPPLWHDLPLQPPADQPMRHSHLLDDDVVLLGIRRTTNANWRLGVENGFDPGHVLIHRDNILILATGRPMALGYKPVKPEALQIIEGDGPKGVKNMYGTDSYEPVVRNEKLNIECAARADFKFTGVRTSMYLPGVLMVENFPEPTLAQYEWYVPIDDKRHEYWQVIARRCATPKEREDFEFRYKHLYEPVALRDFNDNDIFARQAMQPFYENGGWTDEKLCSMDAAVVSWRKLAARYNRGIQPPM